MSASCSLVFWTLTFRACSRRCMCAVCLCALVLGVFSEFQSYELKHTDMQYKNCLVHLGKCYFFILFCYSYFPFLIHDLPLWPRLASNWQSSLSPTNTDVTGVCRCAQYNQPLVWQGHVEFGGSYSLSCFCDVVQSEICPFLGIHRTWHEKLGKRVAFEGF